MFSILCFVLYWFEDSLAMSRLLISVISTVLLGLFAYVMACLDTEKIKENYRKILLQSMISEGLDEGESFELYAWRCVGMETVYI